MFQSASFRIFLFNFYICVQQKKHQQQESAIKMVFIGGYINRKNVDEQGGVVKGLNSNVNCVYMWVCVCMLNFIGILGYRG